MKVFDIDALIKLNPRVDLNILRELRKSADLHKQDLSRFDMITNPYGRRWPGSVIAGWRKEALRRGGAGRIREHWLRPQVRDHSPKDPIFA